MPSLSEGRILGLWRHPVKGLAPERLARALLREGDYFPEDRRYAVEVGPSGFDPADPQPLHKLKFAVLARFPRLARLETSLADDTGRFSLKEQNGQSIEAPLTTEAGRDEIARFLQTYLGEEAGEPLKVLVAPGAHRFMDHPRGFVSVLNLASLRSVEEACGAPIDPLRFRANVLVEGWPAWAEDALEVGARLNLGEASLSLVKPIVRCIATHVDRATGRRDIDMTGQLQAHFGRTTLGSYMRIERTGLIAEGDPARAAT